MHCKTREEDCSWKQRQNFKGIKGKVTSARKNICQEFNKKSKSNWLRVEKKLKKLRHELSQSLLEGSHCQNLYTTSRSGASETSSEMQQLRHEDEHWTLHSRNLDCEKLRCSSAVRSKRTLRKSLS